MTAANLQTEWARLLMRSLADAGVRDLVISPGSRSTPFVVAAVEEKRLTRHTLIDERAAAFFALGQARVTGRPSVLLCTSGTALAHYFPAIIEADLTGVPMLLLTADRPHELYECRAPQTIDQVKLFGPHARQFFDLVPDGSTVSFNALRRIAAQSVLASQWPLPGAVHLNARARKPLEPVVASQPDELALVERARAVAERPISFAAKPITLPSDVALREAASILSPARRGIIVAGPGMIAESAQAGVRDAVFRLAAATGFPLAADATSQLRYGPKPAGITFVDGFELLLRSATFQKNAAFDAVIQIGAPPTSGVWEALVGPIPRVVIAESGWNDPHSTARVMLFGDLAASVDALAKVASSSKTGPAFRRYLEDANAVAWNTADRVLDETARTSLVEAMAVRALVEAAPAESTLFIGNSLAVRLIDIYARGTDRAIGVVSQRGASGIDGLVAGTAGAATASAKPTALLIGDVSLLHDVSSLAVAAQSTVPLVVLVIHNGGGRIFEQLPVAVMPGIDPEVIAHTTTPHDMDFSRAAAQFGVRHSAPRSVEEIRVALAEAYGQAGCTVIEVRVETSGAIRLGRAIAAAMETAIAPIAPP